MMEFHIARSARERYQFPDTLFAFNGNVILSDIAACRAFALRINQVRQSDKFPDRAVHAGQIHAMGLIDEASHALIARYRELFDRSLFHDALSWFGIHVGKSQLNKLLLTFVTQFPGSTILSGQQTPQQWLTASTSGRPNREIALEELLLLWMANRNPAFQPLEELFSEASLAETTVYREVANQLPSYFATRPLIPIAGAEPVNILALLTAPAQAAPSSLQGQLQLLRQLWQPLLGDSLDRYILIAGELLREEELAIWSQFNPPSSDTQAAAQQAEFDRIRQQQVHHHHFQFESRAEVPTYTEAVHEYEKFSPDTAWMPETVMIAKSTYVWLDQLSRQYNRNITRLDQIPDEALATLASRGINTLWLIGVWERSRASRTIKQLCGNTDAVASAYSLFDYCIADDLGGDAAYTHLRDRAFAHGIRLASDMVPNHMGIDSPWVVDHPEWFIARSESPYPAYTFNGPDLSANPNVEIKIDDKYYSRADAAVVFRRRDKHTNETRYIYHGNDGTSFPWNDTAQLDYLNPAVREQVIQTILHVARLFPVIRFDAAMTLAKRHFHRLWFPGPGSSGAIPSRAEYGMSQAEFDHHMPHEFWREVVDRVAAEVPGTLLLAEAFWLMEGYFVRTLGMHRVYNSAFMVMLRDEDNANYRSVIKNTLEFDPDIMKRYVNFMSNPDERTAIDQFGSGDKCFGVAALMATLPGLPMFGHGQIEGFTEKYGMEYRRPRLQETPDSALIERHQREIAPLLRLRWLFAESTNFLLFDFFRPSGEVDENIFAYSNRVGTSAALVVFNNAYSSTHGTLRESAAYADKSTGQLARRFLWQGLGLREEDADSRAILAWRDSLTGLEYLVRASHFIHHGLTLSLRGYQCHVFLNWRVLHPTESQPWDTLCDSLSGRGVPNLEEALVNLELEPVHAALLSALNPEILQTASELANPSLEEAKREEGTEEWIAKLWPLCENLIAESRKAILRAGESPSTSTATEDPVETKTEAFHDQLSTLLNLPSLENISSWQPPATPAEWAPVLAWCILDITAESIASESTLHLFDQLRLRAPLAKAFAAFDLHGEEAWRAAALIKILALIESEPAVEQDNHTPILPPHLWQDPDVRWLTGLHTAEAHEYIVREPYEKLLQFLLLPTLLRIAEIPSKRIASIAARTVFARYEHDLVDVADAGYRLDKLLTTPKDSPAEESPAKPAEPAAKSTTNPATDSESESEPESQLPVAVKEPDSTDKSPKQKP